MNRIEFADNPAWGWLIPGAIVVVALLAWSYRRAAGKMAPGRRWLVLGLRLLTIAVVALCLLDPQWVREIAHPHSGRVALLLDTSRSMGVTEQGRSRIEEAKAWARSSLKLPPGLELQMFRFDEKLEPLTSLDEAAPAGDHTDLAGALEQLRRVAVVQPFGSVVLISDGADQAAREAGAIAKQFANDRLPIHTLCIGSTNEAPDLRIEKVETQPVYSRQATIHVYATLCSPGFSGRQTEARVVQDGKVLSRQTIALEGAAQRLDLEFAPQRDGFQTCWLEIPAQPGEARVENNRREFGITVTNSPLRVLYMEASDEGENHPEIFNLKWALQDAGFDVRALYHAQFQPTPPALRDAPRYVDPRTGEKVYRVEHSRLGYPRTLAELLRFHVLICSDIERDVFTREQLENTVRFVEEFGGGFVMVGGVTAFGAGRWNETALEKIIPVEMEEERDTTFDLFQPRIPTASAKHPLLTLADDPVENRKIWTDRFPQLAGFNRVDRARPGAITLLEHPRLTTQYGPSVILAAQEIGKGRSMAFTSDTTAVWGYEFEHSWGEPDPNRKPLAGIPGHFPPRDVACDNRYYRHFWANAIRWLAANRLALEQGGVRLAMSRQEALPGQDITVTVNVSDNSGKMVRDAKVTVNLLQDDQVRQSVAATRDEAAACYRATLTPAAPGRFLVQAVAEASGAAAAESRQLLLCEDRDVEMSDVRARPELLADIARFSGGQVLSMRARPEKGLLAGDKYAVVEREREPLGAAWAWLSAIVGLLTLEWIARRGGGLA
jgi:uncharacterized membrane protein